MVSFRAAFRGSIWLEVMIVKGLNSGDEQAERLHALIGRISPDKVQLNTVTRPPAEPDAQPVEDKELEALGTVIESGAEVIGSLVRGNDVSSSGFSTHRVLDLVRRRPCTAGDVEKALGLNPIEAVKLLAHMEEKGMLHSRVQRGQRYYIAP
jgi:wyosine [tRNA(Phe)-imidazoG37] synthetase (radical SAM superfamily)